MPLTLAACDEPPCSTRVGTFDLDICADNTPESRPLLGGACAGPGFYLIGECTPQDYTWRGWSCGVETQAEGPCTIDTLVGGEPVRYEVELIHRLHGPCEDYFTRPVGLWGQYLRVGDCEAGAPDAGGAGAAPDAAEQGG
jgi:hypothetical protein